MLHSVLIQHGRAHQIWRDTRKADLPPMHADLLAEVTETEQDVSPGDEWDGKAFAPRIPDDDEGARSDEITIARQTITDRTPEILDALIAKGALTKDDLPEPVREAMEVLAESITGKEKTDVED